MFIAIEGADGCGKTTLCSLLAKSIGAKEYATPPKKYMKLRENIDKNSSPDEHYNFYRNGVYEASTEISSMLQVGEKVVSDRYWLTTLTYHQIEGVSVNRCDFSKIVQPHLTVLLSLNHDVQIRRMVHRGMSAGDRRVLDKQREIASAFYRNVIELSIPFIVLDTQRYSPEECVRIVTSAIN